MTLPIPAPALEQHAIALGKTGSGKSSKLRIFVEHRLRQQRPICIVDPKGDWWGLKSSADGKGAGFPIVIFGGEHADVPLSPGAGASVAELIFTGNRPTLIDLRGWMPRDRTRFFIDFASTAFRVTKGKRDLVLPEIHNFAPKGKVLSPEAGEMLHWANRLASEGRGLGLTILADSQRPQKVHNDFLTSCETLIACRVIHKADRDAIKDWIDGCADPGKGREVLESLASMKREQAWCWSPEIEFGPKLVTFPMFETFDSFAPRAADVKLKGWADVDLAEVREKLASVVQEAEASDPKKLRAEIAALKKQLAEKAVPVAAAAPAKLSAEERKAAIASEHARVRKRLEGAYAKHVAKVVRDLLEQAREITEFVENLKAAIPNLPDVDLDEEKPAPRPTAALNSRATPAPAPRVAAVRSPSTPPAEGLNAPKQKILDQLGVLHGRGVYPPTRQTLAAFCDVSPSSSGYEKNLSQLKGMELIHFPRPGEVELTDSGATLARAVDDGRPAHEFWLGILNEPKQKILNALLNVGEPISREDLAPLADVSASSSGYEKNLSQMRTLGAIDFPRPGQVALSKHVAP